LKIYFQGDLLQISLVAIRTKYSSMGFTKLMKPVISYLRKQGFLSVIYLDDILLLGNSYENCIRNIKMTCSVLEELGFIINREKSVMTPSKSCKYLGFIYHSETMTVELPREKSIILLIRSKSSGNEAHVG
jgi:Reverse transcriptase (RNA-dependent DNA polymerase).